MSIEAFQHNTWNMSSYPQTYKYFGGPHDYKINKLHKKLMTQCLFSWLRSKTASKFSTVF